MSHKDRLSVLDTSFLDLEKDSTHMHVGGLMVFEGPAPDVQALTDTVDRRLDLVPRYRQKVVSPPLQLGRPVWIDDPCFNLDYHVRHTSLPRPGTPDQLRKLVGRIFSQRLDRTKPLWEMWLVDGLEDGSFAVVNKTHHALIDGMSGVDLISVLFDLAPEGRPEDPASCWRPHPKPGTVELVADGVRENLLAPVRVAGRLASVARRPQEAARGLMGVGELLAPPVVSPAPRSPLNTSVGPHRRVAWVDAELADLKAVKNALGGTVNDVVLAVVAGALRRWLAGRGIRMDSEMRAMVPVSVRTEDQRHQLGNRVAAMRGPLPVHIADPVGRLNAVTEAMTGLKESKQALGAETLANLQDFAPPTILAQASRINFSTRLFNVIVTNVPGPQFPLYLAGHRMTSIVPFAFLPRDHALSFAIMSYHGGLRFGLLGDYDKLEDIGTITEALQAELGELLARAGTVTATAA